MYRADYLYYNKDSPVQYSSKSKILQYLKNEFKEGRIAKDDYRKAVNDVIKLGKKIELGTHLQHHRRKISQFHYSLYPNKDQLFQMDLMDLSSYSNHNQGYKWVLFFINAQTKFLRIRPMKNKTGKEVGRSLSSILGEIQGIKNADYRVLIQCDNGKEFYNKDVGSVIEKYNAVNNHGGKIEIYSTKSDHKAAIVESSIRTIRAPLVRSMEHQGPKWIDQINDVVRKYNDSYHSTIKMSPNNAENNFLNALTNIHSKYYKDSYKEKKAIRQKYHKGDIVRILSKNTHFRKGTLRKWTAEIFTIAYVRKLPNKYVYKLVDRKGEIIDGTFDDNDMQLAVSQTVYKFRVLKTRRRNGIKELYVQWDGFPESDNSWIKEVDIIQ